MMELEDFLNLVIYAKYELCRSNGSPDFAG
jgi:hypothetical protein